jgi:HPt (histidine-containing phosphotransfer) domain-containing protein
MTDGPDVTIDRELLGGLEADTSRELMPDLIDVFVKSADGRVAQIATHSETGNLDGIAAEAHALKSSSATFGAVTVRRLSAELEAAAKAGDHAAVKPLAENLTQALEAAKRDLADYAKEVTG